MEDLNNVEINYRHCCQYDIERFPNVDMLKKVAGKCNCCDDHTYTDKPKFNPWSMHPMQPSEC